MIIEPAILAERARLLREKTERELWAIHHERKRLCQCCALLLILTLSLALWGGIWFAVAAVSAWISPWL